MKTKFIRALLAAAGMLTMLLVGPAQATPWTFTTSGKIGSGYDYSETFFGGMATDLTGLAFTLSTVIDPDLYSNQYIGSYYRRGDDFANISFTETLTLNGVTLSFAGNTSGDYAASYLQNGSKQRNAGDWDQAYQYAIGYTADGSQLSSNQTIITPDAFNLGLNWDQVWSYTPQASDFQYTEFLLNGPAGDVFFRVEGGSKDVQGSIDSISINAVTNQVPEPASLALTALALLAMARLRRK